MSSSMVFGRRGFSVFNFLNALCLVLISLLCLLPLIYVISASLVGAKDRLAHSFVLFPSTFDFSAYLYIFSSGTLINSLFISVVITVGGTIINIGLTILTAYPLSRRRLRGRGVIQFLIVFTILFNGGMIPTYLVVSGLGLINTLWALWLPGAISAFYLIVLRNFFSELPGDLFEAAKIDGASEWRVLAAIVVPLSMPSITALSLFYAVAHWNSFFNAILYLNDSQLWPIQVWLRQVVLMSSGGFVETSSVNDFGYIPPENIVYAVIVVATAPVLVIYPFVQKYFIKGSLAGAIKG